MCLVFAAYGFFFNVNWTEENVLFEYIEEIRCWIKQFYKQLHTSNVNNLGRSKREISNI